MDIETIRDNFEKNIARVENLVVTYEAQPDAQGPGRKSAGVLDILRAAVVLLHATLEDVLRSAALRRLPHAEASVLEEIPLVGLGPSPKKFTLGELAVHRGKRVDALLDESVKAYLGRSNYNNTDEISALLGKISIDVAKVNAQFGELRGLMERRHLIVHRADRQEVIIGSGDHKIQGINKDQVRDWEAAVRGFSTALFDELAGMP